MRHGGRHVALLTLALLGPAQGDAPTRDAADLLAAFPLSLDRDADGTPDAWSEIREKGFRAYPGSIRASSEGVLELRMNGRTVGIQTSLPVPVQPGTGYRLEGRCRTESLKEGFAEAAVLWLDGEGREVGRETRPLARSPAWTPFRLEIPAAPLLARSASVRLLARGFEVTGRAWFDSIRMFREPRFEIGGFLPGRLQALPGPAKLTLTLGGLDAGTYALTGEMRALDGRVVWSLSRPVSLGAAANRIPVEVDLPEPGAFRLRFVLSDRGAPVASRETDLGVLGDLPFAAPRRPERDPALGLPGAWISPGAVAGEIAESLSPAAAAVEIQAPEASSSTWGRHPADILLRRLCRQGTRCIGLLDPADDGGASHRAAVMRFLEEVDDWAFRVGERKPWETARRQWDAIAPWAATLPRPTRWGVAMPEGVGAYAEELAPFRFALAHEPAGEGTGVWTRLRLREDGTPMDRVRELSVLGLEAAFSGRSVFLALDAAPGGLLGPDGTAKPELLAWRTLSHLLKGAKDLGRVPLGPGVRAHVLRKGTGTAILAWTEDPKGRASVSIPTTEAVTSVDPTGLTRTIEASEGTATLEIDGMPRGFLVSSAGWLSTRTTLKLDGPVLSAAEPTARILSFENGFDSPLSGTLTLSAPPGWTVSPRSAPVSVPKGGTFRLPVRIRPWSRERTGPSGREAILSAMLTYAEGGGGRMEVQVPFRLEPGGLAQRASSEFLEDRGLLRVIQQVSNRGASEAALDAFVSAAGSPEIRRSLGRLAPGETRVLEHLLPVPMGELLVGARETGGAGRFVSDIIPAWD